jgi:hypothetical protein
MADKASPGGSAQSPPRTFVHDSEIPETEYRTAVALLHSARTRPVSINFELKEHAGPRATYAATCPRCHEGEIVAIADLNADGSFREPPACPALCMACEDRLDALLEQEGGYDPDKEPSGRETLDKYLKAMARNWR